MSIALLIMCKDEFIKVKNIIKSCESVVDEVVVVVTGERKVKESGDYKVLYYPWHDCYSSPLNAGLRLAESDWVFRMDSDEEIDSKNIEKIRPLKSVFELVEAIRRSTPPRQRKKSLARVFQAIRIKVNDELKKLERFLFSFINHLKLSGRIAIISFHSLEDRIVKHQFKNLAKNKSLFIHTKKPLTASKSEIIDNHRSKSAKLRIAEKIINA